MQDSYSILWKALFRETLQESDPVKATELVLFTEQVMNNRIRELFNSEDHHEERSEMDVAKAALLAFKVNKLGWPKTPTPGGAQA
jgi:hypothetical protein